MKAPHCVICNAEHWPREPHVWRAGDDGVMKPPEPKQETKAEQPLVEKKEPGRARGRPKVYADAKTRRREYMREYRKKVSL